MPLPIHGRAKNLTRQASPGSSRGVRCRRCGRDNPESLRFCQDCGARIDGESQRTDRNQPPLASSVPVTGRPEAPTFGFAPDNARPSVCPGCSHAVSATDSFCPECGTSLGQRSHLISAVARSSVPPAQNMSPPQAQPSLTPDVNRGQAQAQGNLRPSMSAPFGVENRGNSPITTQRPDAPPLNLRERPSAASPAVAVGTPSLAVIAQDGTVGRIYPVTDAQVDIGRTEGAICIPDDRFICPRHARIIRNGRTYVIQDLNSVNGVFRRVRGSVPLEQGDTILVGLAVLRFEVLAPGEQRMNGAVERGTQVFGSPSGPRYARLTERTVEGAPRSVFVLTREETILGREVGDIVFSSDPFMSRRHAAITRSPNDGSFTLLDLGSSNGTFLRIRGQAELVPGDHLRVGQHLFRFDHEDGQGQAQAR